MDVVTDRESFVRTVRAHRTAASDAAGATADAGSETESTAAESGSETESTAAESGSDAGDATAADSSDGMRAPVRVPVEVRVAVDDPFAAYRRARTGGSGVYLETTGGQPGWGYFAVDPLETVSVGADADRSALGRLAGVLARDRLVRGGCDVPYPCGVFGWLSYDVARELEQLPESAVDDRGLPRLEAGVFDTVAAWRERGKEHVGAGATGEAGGDDAEGADGSTVLRVTSCPVVGEDPEALYELGLDRARALAAAALEGDGGDESAPIDATEVRFESDCTPAEFAERVRRVKQYVRDGDTFQANVSQRLRAPAAVHPVKAYAALRRVNPAPYSALCEFPSCDLVSASPELLLDVAGERLVTEPIAGTRPRGDTADADAALERDLTTDEKERAEHAMLVDLERNDLGKVARFGTVAVTEYRRVDRYSEVMHLVSLVEGHLRDDFDTVDAVSAVFPGGTITGAPKPRTMEIIDEVEATQRGPYTGSIFAAGYDGRATLNIVIRTLVRWQDEYHLRVGAGIVHDSVPDREYDETLDKGRALVTAIDEALADTAMTVGDDTVADHAGDGSAADIPGDDGTTDGDTAGDST